jgi:hypothetical protein
MTFHSSNHEVLVDERLGVQFYGMLYLREFCSKVFGDDRTQPGQPHTDISGCGSATMYGDFTAAAKHSGVY